MRREIGVFVWLALASVGCNHVKTSNEATEQSNGICPATPAELTGTETAALCP